MAIAFESASSEAYYRAASLSGDVFSFAAWSYLSSTAAIQTVIAACDEATNDNLYRLQFDSGSVAYRFSHRDTSFSTATSTLTVSANTWYHVVGRANGNSDRAVLVNGANKGTAGAPKSSISAAIDNIGIGVRRGSSSQSYANGRIFWPAVWQGYSLTDADCVALAKGLPPWLIHPESLILFCPFLTADGTPRDWISGTAMTKEGTPFTAEGPHVRSVGPMLSIGAAASQNTTIEVPTGPVY